MLTFTLCSILSFLPISFFFAGARGHRHENHPQKDGERKVDGAVDGRGSRRWSRERQRRESARHPGKTSFKCVAQSESAVWRTKSKTGKMREGVEIELCFDVKMLGTLVREVHFSFARE